MELGTPTDRTHNQDSSRTSERTGAERTNSEEPMSFNSWAAQPAPKRRLTRSRDNFDFDAFKIFLILAGLTAGMALALRTLF